MLHLSLSVVRFAGIVGQHSPLLGIVCIVALVAFVIFLVSLNIPLAAVSLVIFLLSGFGVYQNISPFLPDHQAVGSSGNQDGPDNRYNKLPNDNVDKFLAHV